MTTPDALVTAAAEAYHQWQYGDHGTDDTLMEATLVAGVVLAAAFAALPECEEALEAIRVPMQRGGGSRQVAAALARLDFGQ